MVADIFNIIDATKKLMAPYNDLVNNSWTG